jgi:ParB/RepB/Spo0J family partition protein
MIETAHQPDALVLAFARANDCGPVVAGRRVLRMATNLWPKVRHLDDLTDPQRQAMARHIEQADIQARPDERLEPAVDGDPMPPTTTAPRTRAPKRQNKPAPASPPPDSGGADQRQIPLKLIQPSPLNPRKHFDQEELRKLADSMKANGQLQECVVRPAESKTGKGEYYQIVAGERRYQAALLAKLETLRCRVQELTDAQVIELAGVENYDRQDLNPMEVAGWFKSMIDKAGYTQATLAQRLKISQPLVSQRLGLLELPEVWRDRIITGAIPTSWARHLLAWTKHPQILESGYHAYAQAIADHQLHTAEDFAGVLCEAATEISRPLHHGYWNGQRHVENELNKRDRQNPDLQIIELPARSQWRGPEKRCLNIELWDELNAKRTEQKRKQRAKQAAREAGFEDEPGGGSASNATSVEQQLKRAQRAKQQARRVWSYRVGWLQRAVVAKLPDAREGLLDRLLLHLAATGGGGQRCYNAELADLQELPAHKSASCSPMLQTLRPVEDDRLDILKIEVLQLWLSETDPLDYHGCIKPEDLDYLAGELDVDLARDWRMEREFLELHDKAGLDKLAEAWGKDAASVCADAAKRGDKIDALEKLDYLRAPKSLVNAKEPKP